MSKVLNCGDLMPGCTTVIVGKDADEVLEKAEAHARKEHNMTIIPPTVVSQIEAAIKDRPSS
jgi:predicted small metal-binding protein